MSAGLLAFLIAASASLLLTVPVRALAIRVGMVDLPGPRKVHLKPIPLLGGLAMYGGVMMAILIVFDGQVGPLLPVRGPRGTTFTTPSAPVGRVVEPLHLTTGPDPWKPPPSSSCSISSLRAAVLLV